jgi:hypothetical protein
MQADSQPIADPIVMGFLACTLSKEAWTHHAHLRVGLWHVLHFGPEEALNRLRDGIRRLNESHWTANTDRGGYHETITRFFVLVMADFLARSEAQRPFAELAAELIATYPDSKLPLRYYSRELLYSVAARREWVEPDITSWPERAVP